MEGLLAPGYELEPDTHRSLPALAPILVYMTLAPFLSGEEAYEVAIG
jgi:hypothetical protein